MAGTNTGVGDRLANAVQRNTRASAGLVALIAVVSLLLLQVAIRTDEAFAFIGWSAVGALVGAIALAGVMPVVRGFVEAGNPDDATKEARRDTWHKRAWVMAIGGVAVTALASIAFSNPFFATFGIAIAVIGHVILTSEWAVSGTKRPWTWLGVGVAGLVVGLPLAAAATGALLVLGVVIAVFGLSSLKVAVGALITRNQHVESLPEDSLKIAGAGALAAAVGLVLVLVVRNRPSMILGAGLVIAGLSLVGIGATAFVDRKVKLPAQLAIAALGVVLAGVGYLVGNAAFESWQAPAVLLGGLAFIVGAFYVLRGEAVMAMVLFGALLGWVLIDRTADAETDDNTTGLIVALGDSFTAGEGASKFLPYTNSLSDNGNTCRRSPHSYPFVLGEAIGYEVVSYACSGATIDEVVSADDEDGQKDDTDAKVAGHLPQLLSADDAEYGLGGRQPDIVVVSMGGNDANFAEVVAGCILPSDCVDEDDEFIDDAGRIQTKLTTAYQAIATRFPEATIIAIPYPPYVGTEECDGSLDLEEVGFANGFIRELGESVKAVVDASADDQLKRFPDMSRAFVGKTFCDDPRGANFVQLLPRNGPVWERLSPLTWHNGTGHPNDLGYACIGEALAQWVSSEGIAPLAADRPEPDCQIGTSEQATALDTAITGSIQRWEDQREITPLDDDFDAEDWLVDEIEGFAPRVIGALVLALVGGLLAALGSITLLRRFVPGLVPHWL